MTLAEKAIHILETRDDDNAWRGTFPEITAWLATIGIVAVFADIDRETTGWIFPDGSVACEEIREWWHSVESMQEEHAERAADSVRDYYDI